MEVPGGIYLCQVSDTLSCGACCGLYNTADPSRTSLEQRLLRRTEIFARVPRDPASIEAFAREIAGTEPRERPLPGFHHCPYIGLIGMDRSCVGCLLHPLADGNDGVDYRGFSPYGGMACKICFCPAYRVLSAPHREILRLTAPDWHAFGILITEARTVEVMLRAAEDLAGRPIAPDRMDEEGKLRKAIRDLYALILVWPFRPNGFPLGTYFLGDEQVRKDPVDYSAAGGHPSRYDAALQELASVFGSRPISSGPREFWRRPWVGWQRYWCRCGCGWMWR